MSKRTVLIIGTGFLGKAICELFIKSEWTVHGASYSGDQGDFTCDLGDPRSVHQLAEDLRELDVVVHCASSGRGMGIDGYNWVYRDGTANLASCFPKAHLIYTSSSSVYGQINGELVDETSETKPIARTSEVLLEAEENILASRGTVLRLAGLYGPKRSVILKKLLTGTAIIEEKGQRYLNQIHRDDAAAAVLRVAEKSDITRGQVYNVADSTPLTQLECYQALAELLDRPMPSSGPRDINKKRGWTNKRVSNAKLKSIGWSPAFPSFPEAIPSIKSTIEL